MRIPLIIIFCLQIQLIRAQHNQCIFIIYESALLGERYMCQIEPLSGTIEGQQNHLAGKSNRDVTTLEINYLQLDRIPQQIGETFPNLKALYIFEGNMKSLTSEHLRNMPNLRVLSIQNNTEFQVLPSNVFEHTRELEKIVLRNNSLDFIGHNAFDNLANLSLVQLEKNQCIDQKFEDEAITNLSSYLMKNCYGRNEMFCQNDSEGNCSCAMRQYQFIETMDMRQIRVLANCEQANVNELRIKGVPGKDKTEKPFPSFFLKSFGHLKTFVMSNGNLKVLESDQLKPAGMLKKLDLSDNMIEKLRSDVFENAPKLENIDFANNQIKSIGIATFRHLNHLKFVILKGNKLSSKDVFDATEIKNLESGQIRESCKVHDVLLCDFFDLTFSYTSIAGKLYTCKVQNINQQFKYHNIRRSSSFHGMVGKHDASKTADDVKAIVIRDQNCKSLPTFLKPFFANLTSLTIVNASLQALTKNNFLNLGSLERLDVSNNKIKHLSFEIFEATPKLRFIDFSKNRILTADFESFSSLKFLKAVSFLGNQCINVEGVISDVDDLRLIKNGLDICSSIVLSCAYQDPNICKVSSTFDKKVQLRVREVTVE